MKRLALLAAIIAALAVPAKAEYPIEQFLADWRANDFHKVASTAYAAGVVDAFVGIDLTALTKDKIARNEPAGTGKICMPPNSKIDVDRMITDAGRFLQQWPESSGMDAALVLLAVMRKQYPCK
jgi:hypothetical protein